MIQSSWKYGGRSRLLMLRGMGNIGCSVGLWLAGHWRNHHEHYPARSQHDEVWFKTVFLPSEFVTVLRRFILESVELQYGYTIDYVNTGTHISSPSATSAKKIGKLLDWRGVKIIQIRLAKIFGSGLPASRIRRVKITAMQVRCLLVSSTRQEQLTSSVFPDKQV